MDGTSAMSDEVCGSDLEDVDERDRDETEVWVISQGMGLHYKPVRRASPTCYAYSTCYI